MFETGKTKKSKATKAQIASVAMKLFRTKGFDGTTMRDIAKQADIALGATYYYFRSKEEIVMEFYYQTMDEQFAHLETVLEETKDFRERMQKVIEFRMEQLAPYRRFLGVLTQVAIDPQSPLSPFSEKTKAVREKSIAFFGKLEEGTKLHVPAQLEKVFPRFLWLFHLGILFFWIFDRTTGQKRTHRLLNKSLDLLVIVTRLLKLPIIGKSLWPIFEEVGEKS